LADNEAPQEEQSEQEAQADESDAVKKKPVGGGGSGPNQKLVLIVLALNTVVVIVLAAVVWMGYKKSSSQVTLGDIAADKEGHHEEGKDEKGEHGKKEVEKEVAPDNFIKESFTVNLADSQGSHFAQVEVNIEVEDAFARDEIQKIRPKIRDFIVVVLSSKTFEQVESNDGKDFLREEIRNKINGYLTRGQIKNVYFTQFIVQ